MGEKQVVVFPKLSLLSGATPRLGCPEGKWVDAKQREVSIRQTHAAFVLVEQGCNSRLDLAAVRTLKIRELHNNHRRLGASPNAILVVANFRLRRLQ